jgi:hypothetical protein
MATPPPPDDVDPFEAYLHREPMSGAGVRVVVLAQSEGAEPAAIAEGIVKLLRARGRATESVVASIGARGLGSALERGLAGQSLPLVLVTSATEPWTDAHLKPLLAAIDQGDHAVGRRALSRPQRLRRWLASGPFRFLFALPAVDLHSPCRLHRREKLDGIPLQSTSEFLNVEILAKATFLGHLIDEVPVPPLRAFRVPGAWRDFLEVFRHPEFTRRSGPAEEPQSQPEGDDRPGGENRQIGSDGGEISPPQDDHPKRPDELGQG